jgi:hypothetical protein
MKHYENQFSTNKHDMKHWKISYQSISILTHDIRIIPLTKWKNVVFWELELEFGVYCVVICMG